MNELNNLAILLALSALFGVIARLLRQPIILAFLGAGVVIGALNLIPLSENSLYHTLSNLGIMFLLFLVGLEINIGSLRRVGTTAAALGLGQIVITAGLGWILTMFLGFDFLPGAYIAIALTFSSTVIIIKLLSEKRDLNSLYGKITIGLLLVQDLVAIVLLVVLSAFRPGEPIQFDLVGWTIAKAVVLLVAMAWLGRTIIPSIFRAIARSQELIFLASLAWVFVVASLVDRIGLSIEIGGFLAGLALANSAEHFQIASRVRPLRDFFLLLFFFVLGSSITITNLDGLLWPIIVLSAFVLIVNPIIVMVLLGSMGYHRRTGFLTGVTVAQISEFSLVLAALGLKIGHMQQSEVTIITSVGVITFIVSSYLILHADALYAKWKNWLRIFESGTPRRNRAVGRSLSAPIILLGAHRTGQTILRQVPKSSVLIVDFDPDVITTLKRQGWKALYGDMSDPDLFELIDLRRTKLIISTCPDPDNILSFLAAFQRQWGSGRIPLIIVRAENEHDAAAFKAAGVDHVFLPEAESGHHLGHMIAHGSLANLGQRLRHWQQTGRLKA